LSWAQFLAATVRAFSGLDVWPQQPLLVFVWSYQSGDINITEVFFTFYKNTETHATKPNKVGIVHPKITEVVHDADVLFCQPNSSEEGHVRREPSTIRRNRSIPLNGSTN
jgi:hypothetical protein